MDFDLLPIIEIMQVLRTESDSDATFKKIVAFANKNLPSHIWQEYEGINIKRDVEEASLWIQDCFNQYPYSTGIYLGLDTLNMDEGAGTNVEIGLSKSCNPKILSDDWIYECENYGSSHLIKGLFEVSDSFNDKNKWSDDERSFAEYVVFLGYSGIVFKEAFNQIETKSDFLSMWGFHDGDMFFLTQKLDGLRTIVTEVNL